MKKIFTILLLFPLLTGATNYYISATGSDAADGLTTGTPWQTITKFNSSFAGLSPGDSVLFKRGDTFSGTLIISRSGSSGSPIIIGAYGTGAKPIISGFTTVSAWTDLGGGIQESTSAVTANLTMNLVTFQDTLQHMGRWPKADSANSGYRLFQTHSGNTSITSNAISTAASFVGGEVVIKKYPWILDRGRVTAQTGTVVTYYQPIAVQTYSAFANVVPYDPQNNWGFFFQNHINACNVLGEWAYDTLTKKLQMYFGGASPGSYTIKVTGIDSLVDIASRSYIHFDNMKFTGANVRAFKINNSNNIQVNNCDIDFSGITGIEVKDAASNTLRVYNTTFSNCNNNAITAASSTIWTIQNSTFTKIGMINGMGLSGSSNYEAISYMGGFSLVEYNVFRNIGYNGVAFRGDSVVIRYNLIDSFCMRLSDGGAVYTYAETTKLGRRAYNNILINGIGDFAGVSGGAENVYGVYVDGGARNIEITNNTVANCAFGGIAMNFPQNLDIQSNTFYNNGSGLGNNTGSFFINDAGASAVSGLTIKHNIAFARTSSQLIIYTNNTTNNIANWGTVDSNFYCRPILEPSGINGVVGFSSGVPFNDGGIIVAKIGANTRFYSLDAWQTLATQDAATVKTPMTITHVDSLRFEYNATNAPVVVDLPYNYMDARGVEYDGEITLQPYSSAVLIQNGAATIISTIQVPGRKAIVQ